MKHLFLNSYFEAREKHVANSTDFSRMINGKDSNSAMEVLQDTDYGVFALETKSLKDIIEKEKLSFKRDLVKMGFEDLANLYFLREDFVNLSIILKKEMLEVDTGELSSLGREEKKLREDFKEIVETAKKIKDPSELDDYLTECYLASLGRYVDIDKRTKDFVSSYKEILRNKEGEEREKEIRKLEENFFQENRRDNEGLAPILAYFMQKWRAEKFIKAIISGKEAGLSPDDIKDIIYSLRIL